MKPTGDRDYRQALGRFVTGVTVVATRDAEGHRCGMTANSFSSVSLEPPLVSICIAKSAASFDAFASSAAFGISVLSSGQQDIAMRFAKPFADKFDGLDIREPVSGAPIVSGSASVFSCRTERVIEAGDHIILLGLVEDYESEHLPLLAYGEGRFLAINPQDQDGVLVPKPTRQVNIGWLVGADDKVLMHRTGSQGQWSVPMAPLAEGRTLAEAMASSAKSLFGHSVQPDFLYATVDVAEDCTCYFYRASATVGAPLGGDWQYFSETELPWDRLSSSGTLSMLRRFFAERKTSKYGIYLNVGEGRIAQITDESTYSEYRDTLGKHSDGYAADVFSVEAYDLTDNIPRS